MPKKYTIGVDIGATKIVAGLVYDGKIIKTSDFFTKNCKKNELLTAIKTSINSVWTKEVAGIGLGLAGTTDPINNIFFSGLNFPKFFKNINFSKELAEYNIPTKIDNDVHCFGLGEAIYGAGKNYETIFGITLGTGIGGSLIINKKIFRGRNNASGEIGHTTILLNNPNVFTSKNTELEALASGTAIEKKAQKIFKKTYSAQELDKLALSGNKKAQKIFADATYAFAVGCANVVLTINPDIIIVGGGLSQSKSIWRGLSPIFKQHLPYPQLRSTPIVKSSLSHNAIILGATELLKSS